MDGKRKIVPEILAPAGSFESLKAAVTAGCDAVYVGGSNFGARAFADNFDEAKMLEAIDYCHLHNVKIYLTVNTLLGGREIREKLFDFLLPFYEAGLDAVIVQDMGVLKKIKEWFVDIPIHASTQMAVMSGEVGEWLSDFGVTRIVPARELSIGELRKMRQKTKLEIEVFVHGALCYSYSGQCLFSSFQGGRSGNRGMCAAPCRMPYHLNGKDNHIGDYIFSTKELCNLPMLGQMIDAGINSFKIEGRMKKPEYVAFVTSVFKKYRDLHLKYGKTYEDDYLASHLDEWNEDLRCLAEIYNRNGFTCGYLEGKCGVPGKKVSVTHTDMGKKTSALYNDMNVSKMSEPYSGVMDAKAAGNGGMLSAYRPKHGGVHVGKVIKVDKQTVSYRLERDIHTHDVVEFRDVRQRPSYEYTVGKSSIADSDVYKKAGQIVTANYKKGSRISISDSVYRTRDASLIEMIRNKYIENDKKISINGFFNASEGNKTSLTLRYQRCGNGVFGDTGEWENIGIDAKDAGCEITVYGDVCEKAKSHPAIAAQVEKSISQTGESGFVFDKLEISLQGELFLPVGSLKKLRRQALEKLQNKILEPYRREAFNTRNINDEELDVSDGRSMTASVYEEGFTDNPQQSFVKKERSQVIVSVTNSEQIDAVLESTIVSKIYLQMENFSEKELFACLKKCHNSGKKAYLILPRILRDFVLEQEVFSLSEKGNIYGLAWDGFVVRNMESFLFLVDKCNMPREKIVTDSNLYIMNKYAYEFWREQGIKEFMLPYELVAGKIAGDELSVLAGLSGAQVTVYTNIPLMVSAQCTLFNAKGCQYNDGKAAWRQSLTDEKGRQFFVVNSCKYCYNTVYQGEAANYISRLTEFEQMGVSAIRLDFYFEKPDEIRKILTLI